jgi:diguanylate cyclase (GGDEF)-like protein
MKVLVASNDRLFARLAAKKLESWGHRITETYDGNEALEQIKREPYRIVIADWDLPGISGPELCVKIRELKRVRYTYVIVYEKAHDPTDLDADKNQLMTGLQAGADDYLSRPFNPLELQLRLKNAKRLLNLEDELRDGPGTDTMTGVVNESSFRQFFRVILAETERSKARGALMFVRVNNFKEGFAAHGYGPMQKLMVEIAKILERTHRDSDLVSKTAEDEFCLLLQNTYWDKCKGVAEKVMLQTKNLSVIIDDIELRADVSVSTVNFPIEETSSDDVLASTDRIPYQP